MNRIGPYILSKKMSEGSLADVFLAYRGDGGDTNEKLVLKRLNPHMFVESQIQPEWLDNLGAVSAGLSHARAVRVTDHGFAGGDAFFVQPFVFGDVLANVRLLANRSGIALTIPLALRLIEDAAEVVGQAHLESSARGTGTVHGDLTPRNLMAGFDDGKVYVTDYGVSNLKALCQRGSIGLVPGRYGYLSPEQVATGDTTPATDCFALGVILYELLTGISLFQRRDEFETVQAIQKCVIAKPSSLNAEISPAIDQLLMSMLDRDRTRRPANGLALQQAIRAIPGYEQRRDPNATREFIQTVYKDYLSSKR